MKTCVKFKPCKAGQAERHNRRDPEYIAVIKRTCGSTYIREELTCHNSSWRNPDPRYQKPLPEIFEDLRVNYETKVGQKMQLEDKVCKRKNGTTYVKAGAAPIRESCTPIKPDTKIEDFMPFVKWMVEKLGLTVISIDIHRDEGHDDDKGEFVCNNHAHIIVDWMDPVTGKSRKPTSLDCMDMQTVMAESLGMERGTPKEETGIEHLSVLEFKEKKAKESLQRAEERKAEVEKEVEASEQQAQEAKDAASKAKIEMYAAELRHAEEEEAACKSKLRASSAVVLADAAKKEAKVAESQRDQAKSEYEQVKSQIDKLTTSKDEKEREIIRLNKEIRGKRQQAAQSGDKLLMDEFKSRIEWRDQALSCLSKFLYATVELFKRAIDVLVRFAKSIFNMMDGDEARVVKQCLDQLGKTGNDRQAIANMMINHIEETVQLSDSQFRKMSNELDDVVAGGYDARIERSGLSI